MMSVQKYLKYVVVFALSAAPSSGGYVSDQGSEPCLKKVVQSLQIEEAALSQTSKIVAPTSGKIDDKVAIYWYPKAGYVAISHSELQVGDEIWSGVMVNRLKQETPAIAKQKAMKSNKGYFKFDVSVTPEELKRLQDDLRARNGKSTGQMCIGSACKALTKNTGLVVPFPFTQIPTLNAIYLTAMHKLGYARIPNISYVGKLGPVRNLLTTEVAYELYITQDWGRTGITLAIAAGGAVYHFIIDVSSENKNKIKNDKEKSNVPSTEPNAH